MFTSRMKFSLTTYLFFLEKDLFKSRHINVQSHDKFGVPLTLGVKIIPKIISVYESGKGWTKNTKGFDMVLHSELWLCNLTSLPITFGAPSLQLNIKSKDNSKSNKERSSMLNAETALLELSSILEFGDKGLSVNSDNDELFNDAEVLILPKQQDDEVVGKNVFFLLLLLQIL
jgi:hypothetical protein